MNDETHYSAPWCLAVKIITVLSLVLLFVPSAYGAFFSKDAALELRAERLGWQNRFALAKWLSWRSTRKRCAARCGCAGAAGCLDFFGWFRNKKLGVYHAYGTDPKLAVIIKLSRRTIAVTPESPEQFVKELNSLRCTAE